jgi:hypothetical protein
VNTMYLTFIISNLEATISMSGRMISIISLSFFLKHRTALYSTSDKPLIRPLPVIG